MPSFWGGFGQKFGETFGDVFRDARAVRLRREEREEERTYREGQDEKQRERAAKAKRDRMTAAIGAAIPEARERYADTVEKPIPYVGTQREGVMQTALAQDTGVTPPPLPMQTQDWQADQDAIRMDIAERQLGKAEADIGREATSDQAFEDFKRRARATTEESITRSLRTLREVNPEQFQQHLNQQMIEWEALSPQRQEAYNQAMSLYRDKAFFNLDLARKADDAGKAGMLGELLGRQGIRWGKDGKDVIRRLSEAGHDIENAAIVGAAQKSNAEGISLFEKSSYEDKKVALMELATAWPLLNASSATPRSFEFFKEAYADMVPDIEANEDFLKAKFATGTVNRKLRDEGAERADEARQKRKLEGSGDWLKRHGFGVGERLGRIFQKTPIEFRGGEVSEENEMLKEMRRRDLLDEDYRPTNELKLHFRDNLNELMKWELYYKETGKIPSMTLPPREMLKEISTSVDKSLAHVFAAMDRFPDLDINTQGELARLLAEDTTLSSAQVQSAEEKLEEFTRETAYDAWKIKRIDKNKGDSLWSVMVGEENKDKDYILVPEVIGGGLDSLGEWVSPSIGVRIKLNPKYFHRNQMSKESQLRMKKEVEDMEKAGSGVDPNLPISGETASGNKFGDVRVEPDDRPPGDEGVPPQPMKSSAAPPDYTGKVKPSDKRLVKTTAIAKYKEGLEKLGVRKDIIDRRVKALSDYLFER